MQRGGGWVSLLCEAGQRDASDENKDGICQVLLRARRTRRTNPLRSDHGHHRQLPGAPDKHRRRRLDLGDESKHESIRSADRHSRARSERSFRRGLHVFPLLRLVRQLQQHSPLPEGSVRKLRIGNRPDSRAERLRPIQFAGRWPNLVAES